MEMVNRNNDVSDKTKFPICNGNISKMLMTSILLEEAKRARVTRKITSGNVEL